MVISKIILELRTEKKLTQEELASHIGVTSRAVSYWENEINEPKATYIVKLADFFDVSADYLLGREKEL
ncbi:MAG: helix-turn-helix domain-containing protein [Clostridiales bacterium]|jgi:transcriptional regulator with XRE-family HTH domain|nr:helix-turn-helix domain-containing protein [Clostridiales bacterium]